MSRAGLVHIWSTHAKEEGSPSQPPTSRDLTFFVEADSTAGATTIDRHGLPKLCSPPLNSKAKTEEGSEPIALPMSRFVKSTVRRSSMGF